MARKSLDEAVMEWQKNWNAKKEEQWKKRYAKEIELKRPMIFEEWVKGARTNISVGSNARSLGVGTPFEVFMYVKNRFPHLLDASKGLGIVNMTDDIFYEGEEPMGYKWAKDSLNQLKSDFNYSYERDAQKNSVAFELGKMPSEMKDSWRFSPKGKVNGKLLLNGRTWAFVDMGSKDPDRMGGLMKPGGYGRPEPKKYLRGHLYPETIIKEGWMPKKQLKTLLGKPYPSPLFSALRKDGSLETYGPSYY
jgi:hypothetical protein